MVYVVQDRIYWPPIRQYVYYRDHFAKVNNATTTTYDFQYAGINYDGIGATLFNDFKGKGDMSQHWKTMFTHHRLPIYLWN